MNSISGDKNYKSVLLITYVLLSTFFGNAQITTTTTVEQYTGTTAVDITKNIDLSSHGLSIGSNVTVSNLLANGDLTLGDATEVFSLSINGGAAITDLTTEDECNGLVTTTTLINETVAVIDIGAGVPGITLRVQYATLVVCASTFALEYTVDITFTDTDFDGVTDDVDIDDDNDGVLDINEFVCASDDITSSIRTPLDSSTKTAPQATIDTFTTTASVSILVDGVENNSTNQVLGFTGGNLQTQVLSTGQTIEYTITFPEEVTLVIKGPNGAGTGNFSENDRYEVFSEGTDFTVSNATSELTKNDGSAIADGEVSNGQVNFYRPFGGVGNDGDWFINTTRSRTFRIKYSADVATNYGRINIGVKCISVDSDSDGIVNGLDIDSDNDGIPDNIEAQPTAIADGYLQPSGVDADNDGLDDAYDDDDGDASPTLSLGINPVNTDGSFPTSDLAPDFLDSDSDNDGILDINESRSPTLVLVLADADNDGMQDVFEADPLAITLGTSTVTENPNNDIDSPETFFTDTQQVGGDVDYREGLDFDRDGRDDAADIDDDNDGVLDVREIFTDVINWTRGPGASVSKVNTPIEDNNLVANSSNADWNESYFSPSVLDYGIDLNDFKVNFQSTSGSGSRRFALGLNVLNSSSNRDDIDYAIFININTITVSENGANVGTHGNLSNTDVLSIKKTGTVVTYLKNNVVFYTSLVPASDSDYFVDTSFRSNGTFSVDNIQLSPGFLSSDDVDGDGLINSFDIDSDNDGIPDNIEAQTTAGFMPPLGLDDDDDGLDNQYDTTPSGTSVGEGSLGLTAVNTNSAPATLSDTIPDFLDEDSDNDSILDINESRDTTIALVLADADNDGLQDIFESIVLASGTSSTNPNNGITDLFTTFKDDIDAAVELDFRTFIDSDNDGVADDIDLDDDNDGILDTDECGLPSTTTIVPVVMNKSSQTITLPAGSKEVVIDMFRIDNSFNITVNGVNLAGGEIQLHRAAAAPGENLAEFSDGQMYGDGAGGGSLAIPGIWTVGGSDFRVDLRVSISAAGVLSIYGVRDVSSSSSPIAEDAPLVELLLTTPALNAVWNLGSTNEIVLDQVEFGQTYITGETRYTEPCNMDAYDDGDSIVNKFDLDSDNDGIPDVLEAGGTDVDNDGKADGAVGTTVSTMGIPSSAGSGLTITDTDNDGLPNFTDIDADNDGIPDNIEAQPSNGYIPPSGIGASMDDAANNNGVDDDYEVGGIGFVPQDTDLDGTPDYLDLDSDDDLTTDLFENGDADNVASGTDTDGDGLDDAFDDNSDTPGAGYSVNDGVGVGDKITNEADLEAAFGDIDTDFPLPGTGDLDYRDATDTDFDGVGDNIDIDDDNDGILDTVESLINVSDWTRTSFSTVEAIATPIIGNTLTTNGTALNAQESYVSPSMLTYGLDINDFQLSFETEAPINGKRYAIGLNTLPNTESQYRDIDYGIYIDQTTIKVIESSTTTVGSFGSYVDGDVLSIKKEGTQITYLKNGTVFYTSAVPAIETDYFIDTFFRSNTGIIFSIENIQLESFLTLDTDGDGIPNHLDIDSDNDGIPDNIEAQPTVSYVAPTLADDFAEYLSNNGINSIYADSVEDSLTPEDTDGDGSPDYIDTDADNDGFLDINERIDPTVSLVLADADNDGLQDVFEVPVVTMDATTINTNQNNNITDPATFYKDIVNPGGDVDYRQALDSDFDGVGDVDDLDDDNDGILDTIENVINVNDWTRGPGPTVVKVIPPIDTNTITTNTASGNWVDSYASEGIVSYGLDINDFHISFQTASTSGRRFMLGINSFPNTNSSYSDIDYAIYMDQTTVRVYESNSNRGSFGSYSATDVFSIRKVGTQVTYLKNNIVFYTSGAPASETDYFLDTSFALTGVSTIENIQLSSISPIDTDGDGIPNYLDIDSDNDGIPDNIEAQATATYVAPNDDSLALYDTNNGVNSAYLGGLTPENTDGDLIPDYIDTDADNDGVLDIEESRNPAIPLVLADSDKDGLQDNFENLPAIITLGTASINTNSNNNITDPAAFFTDLARPGDDLDYREIVSDIFITQVYHNGVNRAIELTNTGTSTIAGGTLSIALYENLSGDQTGVNPTAVYTVLAAIAPNQSLIIESASFSGSNINNSPIREINADVTSFNEENDILVLSAAKDNTAWVRRLDVVENLPNTTSYVRNDEVTDRNTTFDILEWTAFIDDDLDFLASPPERHPHDPLISEVDASIANKNQSLGYHTTDVTTRTGASWSNGEPDRSRRVVVSENHDHIDALSARILTVNSGSILTVTNSLLAVTESIEITTGTDEIRLIGDSQLVQTHETVSQVSGNGNLLIDQNSTVPSLYRYNYMGSPVNNNGETSYTIKDILKDGTSALDASSAIGTIAKDISFVSGYDGNITDPIEIANYWIYSFDINEDWSRKGSTNSISQTDGFIFKGPGRTQNYTFVGTPKDGNMQTTVSAETSYLLGNPFASAISSKKFIEDNLSTTTGTLYFWEQKESINGETDQSGHNFGGYIGGYAIRNIAMGLAANNVLNTANDNNGIAGLGAGSYQEPKEYIAVAQGFFVSGNGTGGTIEFNNSQREFIKEGAQSVFFRNNNTNKKSISKLPILKLGMDYIDSNELKLHRQIGISFAKGNSFSYDNGYDSATFDLGPTDIYWDFPNNDEVYAIAGVQEISEDLKIPLTLVTNYDGDFKIMIDEWANINRNVFILDTEKKISYLLNDGAITLNLTSGEYKERFVLAFGAATLGNSDDILDENLSPLIYSDTENTEIVINNFNELEITQVKLYDLLGKEIRVWNPKKLQEDKEIKLLVNKKMKGIYFVKIKTNKGIMNKKMFLEFN
jgi:hypothetical protein